MKYGLAVTVLTGTLVLSLPVVAEDDKDMQKDFSYSVGYQVGMGLKKDGIEVETNAVMEGINDAMGSKPPRLSQERIQAVMQAQQEVQLKKFMAMADKNKKAAEKFLAENKTKKGVTTLPSGVQYIVIKEGAGKKPVETDTVIAHYSGKLINGTEFDSSYKREKPATFQVTGVIKGWQEALQLMTVGSHWKVFIPPQLAYGEQGAGGAIGPNEALIFEIELLNIK